MSEIYKPQYWAAKFVGGMISRVGCVVLVLGIVGCIISIGIVMDLINKNAQGFDPTRQLLIVEGSTVAVVSLLFALMGLFMAGIGQHFKVTADNANYSGEMLALTKAGVAKPISVQATQAPKQLSTGKYCSECGAAVKEGSAFCEQCGVKL